MRPDRSSPLPARSWNERGSPPCVPPGRRMRASAGHFQRIAVDRAARTFDVDRAREAGEPQHPYPPRGSWSRWAYRPARRTFRSLEPAFAEASSADCNPQRQLPRARAPARCSLKWMTVAPGSVNDYLHAFPGQAGARPAALNSQKGVIVAQLAKWCPGGLQHERRARPIMTLLGLPTTRRLRRSFCGARRHSRSLISSGTKRDAFPPSTSAL